MVSASRVKKSVIKETVDKECDFFFSFTECLGNTSKQGDFFLFFWPHCKACGILVPRPGMELAPPAVALLSLNHYTPREVPHLNTDLKEDRVRSRKLSEVYASMQEWPAQQLRERCLFQKNQGSKGTRYVREV